MGCCQSKVPPPVGSKLNAEPKPAAPPAEEKKTTTVSKVLKQKNNRTNSSVPPLVAEPPKVVVAKNFECDKGHELKWHSDIPFRYESINSTWLIRCDSCSNTYTGPGYHCDQCNYNLCETCCKPFSKPRQVLFCEANHELLWSPALVWKYKSEGHPDSFNCNLCKSSRHEPSWSCSACNYDVCLKCAQQADIVFPQEYIKCGQVNHPLDYVTSVEPSEIDDKPVTHLCDLCENVINDSEPRLLCNSHKFDVCIECANKRLYDMIPHPAFKCKEGKNLRVQSRVAVKEETEDDIKCQGCGDEEFNYGYICEVCLTAYCFKCSAKIYSGILNSHKQTCPDGHRLFWNFCSKRESLNYNCDICKLKFAHGTYTCSDCNYYICISDFKLE